MALFRYRIFSKEGEVSEGYIDAATELEAAEILRERGFSIIHFRPIKEKLKKFKATFRFFKKVKIKELVIFTRQLSVMTAATLPLVQALRILVQQNRNPYFRTVINDLADEVDGGSKLSVAMSKHPQVFNHFFVSMVRSGETSGKIDEIMGYLADELEKDYDLISRIKGAMIYPAFIVCGLIAVGIIMMIFVIPKLTEMLTASGATLPLTTRILIATSNIMKNYWWLLLVVSLGLIIIYKLFQKVHLGRRNLDLMKIYIPIFGKLFKEICIVRFSRSLSTLLTGGVPLTVALQVTREVVGNAVFEDLIDLTISEVEDGNPIATAFNKSPIIPLIVGQMMNIGEQSGRLDDVLMRIANFYQREINNIVQNLASLIEPVVMLVLGLGVGLMVSAVIIPMYQLSTTF